MQAGPGLGSSDDSDENRGLSKLQRTKSAKRKAPSIEDEIESLDNEIDSMNDVVAVYNQNAAERDQVIEQQLRDLHRLLVRLNHIPEVGSEKFRKRITDMKVKTLKRMQNARNQIKTRSPAESTVMQKAHDLMHHTDYTEKELTLFVGASELLQRCAEIEPVVFSNLEQEQQRQVEEFFFNEVIPLITREITEHHLEIQGDYLKTLTKEVAALKKLCQELLAQMIATRAIPTGDSETDQLRRKAIAMTLIITTSANDKSFGDNIGTLLQALTLTDLLKGAFTGAVCLAAAQINPTLTKFVTSAASMLGEVAVVTAGAAAESPALAVGTAWHVARFIDANMPRSDDWLLRETLLNIEPRRTAHLMTQVFGERTPILGWWDVVGVAKRVFQIFGEGVCMQVKGVSEMVRGFNAAPAAASDFCSRSAESLNSTIGRLANNLASRHGLIDSITISRARDVLTMLLDTPEYQVLKDDEFIAHILLRLGLLDDDHVLTEAKFKKYEAELIGRYGIGPQYRAQLRDADDSMQTGVYGKSESPDRATVLDESDPSRQERRLMVGPYDEAWEMMDSAAAVDAAAEAKRSHRPGEGLRLNIGQRLSMENGANSAFNPGGPIHTGPLGVPNAPKEDDGDVAEGNGGVAKGNGGVAKGNGGVAKRKGGKRTARRKGAAKKQKSKKNKRQSRRKARRSSSRKSRK